MCGDLPKFRVVVVRTRSLQCLSSGLKLELGWMDRKCSPYLLTSLQGCPAEVALDWKLNAWSNLSLKQDLGHFQGWVQLIPVLGTLDGQGLAPCSWILVFLKACFQTMNVGFHMFIFPFKPGTHSWSEDPFTVQIYFKSQVLQKAPVLTC